MCLEIESEYVYFPYQILLKKNEFGDTALFDEKTVYSILLQRMYLEH